MEQTSNIIEADDKSVRQVLDKIKYTIDVFQREYKWERKHIAALVNDLTVKFFSNYKEEHSREEVAKYDKYYLGSIVLCLKDSNRAIIDGQQRLTSITLFLIYLYNLQKRSLKEEEKVDFDQLIFSQKYSVKSFNLQVEDRKECIEALYSNGEFDASKGGESVKNLVERYHDIEELFPEELKGRALPYFIDWLTDNVIFVEIVTYSDDDAYTIFETMNDRGLNLTPAEMLKGYLISNLASQEEKIALNEFWKAKMLKLNEIDKNEDLEFFKAWLRAKYAESIRQTKKGSENEDFEKIGTRFHSWVRDNKERLGLKAKADFYKLIKEDFDFYTNLYLKINNAAHNFTKNLESIYYLHQRDFPATFYFPVLMAPISLSDDEAAMNVKLALVSRFIETYIVFRSVNYRTLAYNSIRYAMYSLVKDIRDKDAENLSKILKEKIEQFEEGLEGIRNLALHSQNKRFIHFLLARITRYIEEKSSVTNSSFENYVNPNISQPFEVEHIWSDKFENYRDEFEQRDDWEAYRNKIGALVLLPKDFNQSYGAWPYEKKYPHYYGQNLLAKSLNAQCYERNPSFLSFVGDSGLPFKPYDHFKKKDLLERTQLYQQICEQIYDLKEFDRIVNA